ncbi:hypothetical protein GC176_22990 [bacterium]|nr:hypothetical protein [bacterium]
MRIHWMTHRTAVALTAGTVTLAALSQSSSGLLAGLFSKDKCELPKRIPCGDCLYGYARTVWRPWGTCCDNSVQPYAQQPLFVPGHAYTPLPETPYSTAPYSASPYSPVPGTPYDGAPIIIDSLPGLVEPPYHDASPQPAYSNPSPADSSELTPILPGPSPGGAASPIVAPNSESLIPDPRRQPTPSSNVRSIETPAPNPQPLPPANSQAFPEQQELPLRQQPALNQYRGPIEDPIRGLLPGMSFAAPQNSASPVTGALQNSEGPSFADDGLRPDARFQSAAPALTPGSKRSQPATDYSEYIPLPNASSIPQSLPLPDPAERSGRHDVRQPVASPQQDVSPSTSHSFDADTIPLPQSGTRPGNPSSLDPDVGQHRPQSPRDPYEGYQTLPTATEVKPQIDHSRPGFEELPSVGPVSDRERVTQTSAEHFVNRELLSRPQKPAQPVPVRSEQSQRILELQTDPEPACEVPDWKPLSDPSKTYRSTAPARGRDWRTLQTPAGKPAPTATSQQNAEATRITAPPWQSGSASATSSRSGDQTIRQTGAARSAPTDSLNSSVNLSRPNSLPSVEALLSGACAPDSRPARVVQETLYDVIDVDRESRRRPIEYSVATVQPRSRVTAPSSPVSTSESITDWHSIRAADGSAQSPAQSSRLTR